jgi:predicted HicB family RNase H-like nuclease
MKPESPKKTSVSIPMELYKKVKAAAAAENRTINNWIVNAIIEMLKQG